MSKLIGTGNNQVSTNGMLGGMAFQSPSNVQAEKLQENRFDVVTQSDIGLNANQIPINGMLGSMAFMETGSYSRAYEIQNTDISEYAQSNGNYVFGIEASNVPTHVAWPEYIDLWRLDFAVYNLGSGRNDWFFSQYYSGTSYASFEWNCWELARKSYANAGLSAGWNQIQASDQAYNWGKFLQFNDASVLVSGHVWLYRGGYVQRPGFMWDFNHTAGGIGATRAFGSSHSPSIVNGDRADALIINVDPNTSEGAGTDQAIYGKVRQTGYVLI